MRAAILGNKASAHFAAGLLRIGTGRLPVSAESGLVSLDGYGTFVDSTEELQEKVYPNLRQRFQDVDWLSERAIICLRNDAAAAINSQLLAQLPDNSKTFTSVNTSLTDDAAVEHPVKFLTSLELLGLPAHKLQLKIGTPIVLLCNLNPPKIQFPIRVCFAMTINKSQGQSLKVAGIDLLCPCLSHGQLHVASSRIGTS
ncbi:uncharacterized protein [Watersipora subatra]|uniref:uncharacterized protein n=1 Tax=Watersipora subatra TaxID=2589382 RepID=UPI00355BC994